VLEKKLPLIGTVVDGYWEDVGTLEAYLRAQDVLDSGCTSTSTASASARGSGSGGRRRRPTARIEVPS